MGRTKKWISILISVVMLASLLAACGNANQNASSDPTPAEESKGSGEKVTLRMIESLTSPSRTKLLQEMIAKFELQNSNIRVELISPPLESADQKIQVMLTNKENIDVLEVRDQTVKQFSQNKLIASLQPYVDKWQNWDGLTDVVKENASYVDNTTYFIPYGIYQKTLFYRKDWFEDAGIAVPKTWDELYDAAVKLTDKSKNRYGYSFRGGAGAADYIEFMTWAYAGDKIDPVDSYFTKDKQPMYTTPEAKQALEMLVKMYKDASPPDSISWSYPEMVQGFTSGVTAMLIQDPEVIITCQENMEEGTWATAPLPLGPSGIAQQTAGTAGWGISSYSEHKDEAWKLIEFLSSPEESLFFAKNNSLIPIYKSAGEDPFFKEGPFLSYITMNAQPDAFKSTHRPIDYKGWGQFRASTDKDIQSVVLNKLSADDALKKWSDFWADQKKQKEQEG